MTTESVDITLKSAAVYIYLHELDGCLLCYRAQGHLANIYKIYKTRKLASVLDT